MNADIQRNLTEHLHPDANIVQCWGLTETSWVSTFEASEKDDSGSVGRLLPNVEVKIVDDNGDTLRDEDANGEAWVRSPANFSGYRASNPGASDFDIAGFYRTGDLIRYSHGKVFVVDRLKDTFKVKGWQVSPSEVEAVLMQHPNVVDAAVVPVRHVTEVGLEELLPRAYVTYGNLQRHIWSSELSSGESVADTSITDLTWMSEDIKAFVASKVVTYKRLTGGVVFIPHIPRSATGKVLRKRLESFNADAHDHRTSSSHDELHEGSNKHVSAVPDTKDHSSRAALGDIHTRTVEGHTADSSPCHTTNGSEISASTEEAK